MGCWGRKERVGTERGEKVRTAGEKKVEQVTTDKLRPNLIAITHK